MAKLSETELATIKDAIKMLIENIRNDVAPHQSADKIADLVEDHKLQKIEEIKPLLKNFSDVLLEKGFTNTSNFLNKQWHL
jgi:hypothetical protein